MKVAVIGAGWAGLAAAVALAQDGVEVSLFEAGRVAGGRARGVAAADGFSFWDNGQHLLIGAYAGVFELLGRIGVDAQKAFRRERMHWYLADGVRFQAAFGVPPVNVLLGLAGAQGANWREKMALMGDLLALLWWQQFGRGDKSVADFLQARGVSAKWRDGFWQPLVWGALNTPLSEASLRVLANVLHDGGGSDFCLPVNDLGELLVNPALATLAKCGGRFVAETRVGRLKQIDHEIGNQINKQIIVNDEYFDRVVVAVAPYHLAALLPDDVVGDFQAAFDDWAYHAITTVYLRYAKSVQLPVLMTGFVNGTAQWLIDRERLNGAHEVAAVISLSEQHGSLKAEEWVARVHADVLRVSPNVSEPLASQVITEKRATIAATPTRQIPNQKVLNDRGIFLAGDYLNGDYPATLEAAVLSGLAAAKAVSGCL